MPNRSTERGETCASCRFKTQPTASTGDCRRHPPLIIGSEWGYRETRFPQVHRNEWCGEHQPRPAHD